MYSPCIYTEDSGLAYEGVKLKRTHIGFQTIVIGSSRTLVVMCSLAMDVTMDTSAVQQILSGRKRK
jgi:hypothetical protein